MRGILFFNFGSCESLSDFTIEDNESYIFSTLPDHKAKSRFQMNEHAEEVGTVVWANVIAFITK